MIMRNPGTGRCDLLHNRFRFHGRSDWDEMLRRQTKKSAIGNRPMALREG